jgi:hypothetical protein
VRPVVYYSEEYLQIGEAILLVILKNRAFIKSCTASISLKPGLLSFSLSTLDINSAKTKSLPALTSKAFVMLSINSITKAGFSK